MKDTDSSMYKKINMEITPGNQHAMDDYIEEYNRKPDRKKAVREITPIYIALLT
ncbi:MAG: hypothetical protein ACOCWH_05520 [Spirochaetota bacterium]